MNALPKEGGDKILRGDGFFFVLKQVLAARGKFSVIIMNHWVGPSE